jgi:hypothetical protein
MKQNPEKPYWSKTYAMGVGSIYAWERLERGGFVFVLFRDGATKGKSRREKQKLAGNLRVRDAKGRIDRAKVREVDLAVATFGAQLLLGQRPTTGPQTHEFLSLSEGFERALDIGSGKYPAKTPRWHEVGRAKKKLERILGKRTAWVDIKPADVRRVGRTLANEYKNASAGTRPCGPRQAEVTVDALYTIANWLREEEQIPADAVMAPTKWRSKLKREWEQIVGGKVAPSRPRHTTDELGRLIAATHHPEVDPRFALAFDLGGEQRLGQVLCCQRSQLDLSQPNGSQSLGLLRVPGAGHKEASPIVLTTDQRAAVDAALQGYLVDYETLWLDGKIKDYPLFPAGRFKRQKAKVVTNPRPLTRDAALGMFRDLERLAEVTTVHGRGWYGVRRIAADKAEDVEKDERVLNSITGHRDSTTRRMVYQDRERPEVLNRAAVTRDRVRREAVASAQQSSGQNRLTTVAAQESGAIVPQDVPQKENASGTPRRHISQATHLQLVKSERATGLEPATSSLGSWHSTN